MTSNESYDLSFPPLPTPPETPSIAPTPTPNFSDNSAAVAKNEGSNIESKSAEDAYESALDDVHTRFLLNLPSNELASSDRIFFQLEQAYWFYDDFYCDKHDENSQEPPLPRFKNLRHFCQTMFQMSPLLSPSLTKFNAMWEEFASYKRSISTYGTILLNADCTKLVLCQDWNGKSWTFPAGKINQHETGVEAGARETYEETGFDINCQLGLTRDMDVTWKKLNNKDALTYTEEVTNKERTCYVCRGVPEDFPFEPVARKEVSDVKWFDLGDLPKKTFAVLPFVGQLRKWIRKKGYGGGSRGRAKPGNNSGNETPVRNQSAGKQRANNSQQVKNTNKKQEKRNRSRNNSRGKVREGDSVTQSGLANIGDKDGWTEDEMFSANERILGRQITYDGNPHTFADAMMESNPHKFHIVGGSFMNSSTANDEIGGKLLAPPPEKSALQPLFSIDNSNTDEKELKPFFSEEGKTPWGEVAIKGKEVSADTNSLFESNEKGLELLSILNKEKSEKKTSMNVEKNVIEQESGVTQESFFLTDKEITARSQKEKLDSSEKPVTGKKSTTRINDDVLSILHKNEDWIFLRKWVNSLERPPPSKHFGEFKFDVDAIMDAVNSKLQ